MGLCSFINGYECFGGMCCVHLQGRKVRGERKKGCRYREGMSRPWPWANQWKMRDIKKWEVGRESLACHQLQFMSDDCNIMIAI